MSPKTLLISNSTLGYLFIQNNLSPLSLRETSSIGDAASANSPKFPAYLQLTLFILQELQNSFEPHDS